jgi:hypothetical protein
VISLREARAEPWRKFVPEEPLGPSTDSVGFFREIGKKFNKFFPHVAEHFHDCW